MLQWCRLANATAFDLCYPGSNPACNRECILELLSVKSEAIITSLNPVTTIEDQSCLAYFWYSIPVVLNLFAVTVLYTKHLLCWDNHIIMIIILTWNLARMTKAVKHSSRCSSFWEFSWCFSNVILSCVRRPWNTRVRPLGSAESRLTTTALLISLVLVKHTCINVYRYLHSRSSPKPLMRWRFSSVPLFLPTVLIDV